MGPTVC